TKQKLVYLRSRSRKPVFADARATARTRLRPPGAAHLRAARHYQQPTNRPAQQRHALAHLHRPAAALTMRPPAPECEHRRNPQGADPPRSPLPRNRPPAPRPPRTPPPRTPHPKSAPPTPRDPPPPQPQTEPDPARPHRPPSRRHRQPAPTPPHAP